MDEKVKELVETAKKIDAAAGRAFNVSADACIIAASNLLSAADQGKAKK